MILRRPVAALGRFFFAEVGAETLCCFRLLFGIFFVGQLLGLAPLLLTYFPEGAPIPVDAALAHYGRGAGTVLSIVRTPAGVILLYFATLIIAVCAAAGLTIRLTIPLTLIAFLQWRNAALFIWDGGDIVSTTILYHLSLAALAGYGNQCYAIDTILRRRHAKVAQTFATIPAWPLRLLQVQLCLIYFFSAWYKTQRPDWQTGEAVHYVVQQLTWSRIDLTWISSLPALAALLSYLVLAFQMSFPFLVWVREMRPLMLWSAVIFHATIELTMSIFAFSVMILYPLVFVHPDTVRAWVERFKELGHRSMASLHHRKTRMLGFQKP